MKRAILLLPLLVACSSADASPASGVSGESAGDDAGSVSTGAPRAGDAGASRDDGRRRASRATTRAARTSSDAGSRADAPTASGIDFAPYFPTWVWGASGYAFTSLVDLQTKSGVNAVTIAFVLADGGCKADRASRGTSTT